MTKKNKAQINLLHTDTIKNKRKSKNNQTQFNYWFFFTHPFLVLHNLSPDSTFTNLHIFLFLSQNFLSVTRRWLHRSYKMSPNVRKSKCSHPSSKRRIFVGTGLDKSGKFGVRDRIFRDIATKLFNKHVKPGSPSKMGTNGIPDRGTAHRSTLAPYVHASQHLRKPRWCNPSLPCRRLILLFICVLLFHKPTNGNEAYVVGDC